MIRAGRRFSGPVLIALAAAPFLAGCPSRPPSHPAATVEKSPVEAAAEARDRLARARRESGEKSIEAARALDAMVEALYRAGQATAGETRASAEESLEIRRKLLAPGDPELATSLNNLGAVLHARGDYGRARALYQEALAIRRTALAAAPAAGAPAAGAPPPPGAAGLVEVLNNLAEAERRMGDIAAAKSHFREAIGILEATPADGRRDQSLAMLRNNLGLLLHDTGDLAEARESMEKARDFWARDPERRRDLARVSNNLGRLLHDLGDLPAARESFERALAIHQRLESPNLPEKADALNNFGYLHSAAGDSASAKPLYLEALALREKALGNSHPSVAWTLINLGLLDLKAGDLAEARPLLERAAEIRKESFGEDHWLFGHSLTYLACLRLIAGETAPALEEALRAEEIRRDSLLLSIPVLAERQALGMAALEVFGLSAASLDLALSAASAGEPGSSPERIQKVWNALMRSRGVVLDEAARRLRAGGASAAAGKLRDDLARARQDLANLWVRGALRQSGESYRNLLGEARRRVEEAEAALGLSSPSPRSKGEETRALFDQTRDALSALRPECALVAFARYQKVEPPRAGKLRPVPSYLAFLLAGSADPRAFELGPADEIDGLVARWRSEVMGAGRGGAGRGDGGSAGEELRRKVWDPIAVALGSAERVFVVPDGSLNLVSFAGLPAPGGGSLVETGPAIHYLSAEKDLRLFLPVPPAGRLRNGSLLVVGDPDFGEPGKSEAPGGAIGFRDSLPPFERLPATGREIEEVARIFLEGIARSSPPAASAAAPDDRRRVTELAGPLATESSFKRLAPGKSILHLATHGFCLEGGSVRARPGPAGQRGVGDAEDVAAGADSQEGFENPLLLSGLALAGANRREGAAADDDGILTGEEIAALDLSGVEWAVLSACKTGVGKIRRGEGVLGLRRAFQVAGAGTLIASLWPVEDNATREWMAALYRARFIDGLDSAESARRACLTVLRARRERKESDSPFYWAGFVASGDWR